MSRPWSARWPAAFWWNAFGWQAIFYVNLPVGVIGFVLAAMLVPRLGTHPHKFDVAGIVISAVGLFLLVFGLQEGEKYDWGVIWGPISVWSLIIAGVVVLALFVWQQSRTRAEALVPLNCSATATSRPRTWPSPRSAARSPRCRCR